MASRQKKEAHAALGREQAGLHEGREQAGLHEAKGHASSCMVVYVLSRHASTRTCSQGFAGLICLATGWIARCRRLRHRSII